MLIILDCGGFFEPKNLSFLYHFAKYNKPVVLEGRVISDIEKTDKVQKFVLKVSKINGLYANERSLISAPKGYDISYGDEIVLEGYVRLAQKAFFPLNFDYRKYLAREKIWTVFNTTSFEFIKSAPNPIMKAALYIRSDIIYKIDSYFSPACASLLKPLIIGDKSSLQKETKDAFTDAGLMHILVVSGLNVGFVGGLFLIIFKTCGLSLKKTFLFTIPFIFIYVLITGANPPVTRAGIMFSCILISLSLNREPLIYNSLALSALLILSFNPQQLFSASFQMSYLATIGIVYFYDKIHGFFKNIKKVYLRFIASIFCVTAGAQILMLPICAYYFGKISLISILSNMLIVPVIGIITTIGFIFYFLSFIAPFAAKISSYILSIMLEGVLFATRFLGQIKYASVPIAKPAIAQLIFFFAFIFCASGFKGKKRLAIIISIAVFAAIFSLASYIYTKDKIYTYFYENANISISHIKQNNKNTFTIKQKEGRRYDKYYLHYFKEYLSFAGIKKADIYVVGIKNQEEFKENFKDKDYDIIE
ncbi:MAG: ComEC family competence protein [Elusimicrobiota bacterium]|nr:ComEC family competence protein [Elusimicrobiota bacterium]